jgi:hypothetical protein
VVRHTAAMNGISNLGTKGLPEFFTF